MGYWAGFCTFWGRVNASLGFDSRGVEPAGDFGL
jgi:hypothetical protein